MAAQHRGATLVAGDLVKQALELGDVAVYRLLEAAVAAIFAADLIECLLSSRRIEPLGEGLTLAALIPIPHLGGEVAIHQPADIKRQGLQWIAARALGGATARRLAVAGAGIRSIQQFGKPAVA